MYIKIQPSSQTLIPESKQKKKSYCVIWLCSEGSAVQLYSHQVPALLCSSTGYLLVTCSWKVISLVWSWSAVSILLHTHSSLRGLQGHLAASIFFTPAHTRKTELCTFREKLNKMIATGFVALLQVQLKYNLVMHAVIS